jgi:AraC-like DNA-binding protein
MSIRMERHDSDLGRWLLARCEPERLAGLVEGIWYFEGSLTHLRERHFPTGRAEIVVHLGERYRHVEGSGTELFPLTCASGLLLGPDVIEAPPGWSAVLGIRLRPLGAYTVLGHPLEPLTGITVDLEDLADADARRLTDLCAQARTPEGRLRAATSWVEERARWGPRPDAAVAWMSRAIEGRAGDVSIRDLTEHTGWSRSRMQAAFRAQVGVSPKRLARIHRFRRALGLVMESDGPLSEVALVAGYYDQPHFNGEFREMSGFTPSAYRAAHRFPESPSLAEHAE